MSATVYAIALATIAAGTPLLLAALGELVTEKSGVLNLGLEGMMLAGAVLGFIVAVESGSLTLGVLGSMAGGMLLAAMFGVLVLGFQANQVASGLALTIFGIGLSAYVGLGYTGIALRGIRPVEVPLLSDLPVIGALFATLDPLIYLSFALLAGVIWFLYRTRAGLVLRSIGESPESAHAIGHNVIRVRFLAVLFGGAMAGLGGGYLALAYTPLWSQGMTAGKGWIAIALVVFATWRPMRVLAGAYLFGGITVLQFHGQGLGIAIPSQFLAMLPYAATILVLVLISRNPQTIRLNAPLSLARPFHPGN